MEFGDLLRYRRIWVTLPELTKHWEPIFDGQIQGCSGRSLGELWLALYPDHSVAVDKQVAVEELQPLTMIGLKIITLFTSPNTNKHSNPITPSPTPT